MPTPQPWPRIARHHYYRFDYHIKILAGVLLNFRFQDLDQADCEDLLISARCIKSDCNTVLLMKGGQRWPNTTKQALDAIRDNIPAVIENLEICITKRGDINRELRRALLAAKRIENVLEDATPPVRDDLQDRALGVKPLDLVSNNGNS